MIEARGSLHSHRQHVGRASRIRPRLGLHNAVASGGLQPNSDPHGGLKPGGVQRRPYLLHHFNQTAIRSWIESCATADLQPFADEQVQFADQWEIIEGWRAQFFAETGEGLGDEISFNLFHIARHLATHEGQVPTFFVFDERDHHDLDQIAARLIAQPLLPRDKFATLEAEYRRSDRYWSVFYPNMGFFKSQYDACENRILLGDQLPSAPPHDTPEVLSDREPSPQVKDQVRQRDGYRCLSCDEDTRSWLQIDHVAPHYLGGGNSLANLQTLCKICNNHKGISEINFRHNETMLPAQPTQFPTLEPPTIERAANPEAWRRFVRRSVNFFYRCAAVADIGVDDAPEATWNIRLWASNDPHWLEPFLGILLQQIQARRFEGGASRPATLTVSAPDHETLRVTAAAPVAKAAATAQPGLAIMTTTQQVLVVSTTTLPLMKPGDRPIGSFRPGTPPAVTLLPSGLPLVAVSTFGKAYGLPTVNDSPAGDNGRVTALTDVVGLEATERICLLTAVPKKRRGLRAVILTNTGMIKRLAFIELADAALRGRTIRVGDGEVVAIGYANADDDLIVITSWGYAIRFPASDVPEQLANAAGVRAASLGDGEVAVALAVADRGANTGDLVVVTKHGQAKRTPLADYRVQGRCGIGLHTSLFGGLIAAFLADVGDELILLSKKGKAARFAVVNIPQQGRATVGNHLVTFDSDDHLISALVIPGNRR